MRIAAIALSGAVIFGVAVPATAAFILDQNQPSATVYMAAFSQTDLAQSFQTQDYNSIAGAGIHLYTNGTTGNITISLWDYLPNNGGTMMATGTAVGTPGEWVDVYWDSVAITPNTEYFLVFTDEGQVVVSGAIRTIRIRSAVSMPTPATRSLTPLTTRSEPGLSRPPALSRCSAWQAWSEGAGVEFNRNGLITQ